MRRCISGEGSYCTKFGNAAEFQTKDYAKAFVWYKKGCEAQKKEPVCCMGVARLTIQAQGTTADVAGGLKLWTDTCAMSLGRDSCSELAVAYEGGKYGVKKDAKHPGGVNIFGRGFGNYDQDIVLRLHTKR